MAPATGQSDPVKTQWIPALTEKQAIAICGSLSNPSKMPGHGYALPAYRCRLGSFLQQLPKAICFHCYALRGRYTFPNVKAAMEKRFSSLTHVRWIDAVTTLIYHSKDRYFRWHDSGDIQDIEHLEKIAEVAKRTPNCMHWLPTREYGIVSAFTAQYDIPKNLIIRLSAMFTDKPVVVPASLNGIAGIAVSNVHSKTAIGTACNAPKQNGECRNCRACWSRNVAAVSYSIH
jgi:hypothetical protein